MSKLCLYAKALPISQGCPHMLRLSLFAKTLKQFQWKLLRSNTVTLKVYRLKVLVVQVRGRGDGGGRVQRGQGRRRSSGAGLPRGRGTLRV